MTYGYVYALHLGDHDYRYVGITTHTPELRLDKHRRWANGNRNTALYDWMRKHGPYRVQTILLEACNTADELGAAETKWIHVLNTHIADNPRGRNMTYGGKGTMGHPFTEEAAEKRRQTMASRAYDFKERGRKSAETRRGQKRTDEQRARMSEAAKRRDPTTRKGVGVGRTLTEERRNKPNPECEFCK